MKKGTIFLILFLILPTHSDSAVLLDRVVAIVNKEVLTWSDLYKTMEFEAHEEVKKLKPEERRRLFKENEHAFLETMIDMRLKLQEAEKKGLTISKEELNNAMEMIRNKYNMTKEDFQKAIAEEGFTLKEYEKRLSEQLLLSRIVDREVRSKIIISEQEIDEVLKKDQAMIRRLDGYVLSIIKLAASDHKDSLHEKARQIKDRLSKGEPFAELARQYSSDPSSKTGGFLGFVSRSELSPQMLKALEGIAENSTTEPIQVSDGVVILMLHEKKEIKGDRELREAVRQKLLEESFNRQYRNWLKGLRERSYVEIKL